MAVTKKKIVSRVFLFLMTLVSLVGCNDNVTENKNVTTDSVSSVVIKYPLTKNLDTLLGYLKTVGNDTNKVNVLNGVGWQFARSFPDSSIFYERMADSLSEVLHYALGQARAFHNIGYAFGLKGDFDTAKVYTEKGLKIFLSEKYLRGELAAYNSLGSIHSEKGEYDLALENYLKVLQISEESNNVKGQMSALSNIGIVYDAKNDHKKALEYFRRTLVLAIKSKDKSLASTAYVNFGKVFGEIGMNDSVIFYAKKSLEIKRELNDRNGIATCLINIGASYENMGEKEKAIQYDQQAYTIQKELGDKKGALGTMINIANLSVSAGKFKEAIGLLDSALYISMDIGSKDLTMQAYNALSGAYSAKGDFKNGLSFHKKYSDLRDSLLSESSDKNMAEMETKFETAKKDKEITILNKDKALQETEIQKKNAEAKSREMQRNVFIVGFLLVLALALFVLYGYRQKKRSNNLLAQKNALIEEKNKNILDSINYAQRIQKAMLTSEAYLKNNLPEYFILNKPKDIVSGDFYWATKTDDKKFYFFTADCTGHGVPGAFMSLIGVSILNEIVIEKKIRSTAEILNQLRLEIINSLNPDGEQSNSGVQDGMDGVLCVFDFKNMTLDFSCANNPLWLMRGGNITVFAPDKMPIGKYQGEKKSFSNQKIHLQKGDIVYTFSDGFADQFGGPQGKKFKYKQLQEQLVVNAHLPPEMQKSNLNAAFENWKADLEQVDDVLLVGIKV